MNDNEQYAKDLRDYADDPDYSRARNTLQGAANILVNQARTIKLLRDPVEGNPTNDQLTRKDKIAIAAMKGMFASKETHAKNVGKIARGIADEIMGEEE